MRLAGLLRPSRVECSECGTLIHGDRIRNFGTRLYAPCPVCGHRQLVRADRAKKPR